LPDLAELHVRDNPLQVPPPEVADKGIHAIREYFRQLGIGEDFLYEAKLLIIGEGGAGKTTLARKLEDPIYKLQEEQSTEGIDVLQWSFPMENNKKFRVNIWDFGGQEIYHTTHQFFLTKRSLYILVADTRKEDTDFYYWMNTVELLSDSSPLFIVKNEKQDRHREINERQLRGQFENLRRVFSTNFATNRGLGDLVEEIKQEIKKLPHIGSPLPRTWVRVRETLENDYRDYIDVDTYLDICQKNGFSETKDGLQLSGYLHDLGVFLHFQDDPLLKKLVILKPKWGTDAVYKVLDNQAVIRNLGRFTRINLVNIWNDQQYIGMHDELLQLMMKFRLCYEIPGVKGSYIAPQLLTENQPDYPWKENENLLLRYSYEFMPKGILTQFIVAMNEHIVSSPKQSLVWRGGVVIAKDRTAAEVIEHYGKREIRIRVAGHHKKELLSIVMFQLDQIHKSYTRIKFHKLIPCNCEECRSSLKPHFYRYEQFQNFIEKRLENIQCGKSGAMVNVRSLIDDVMSKEYQQKSDLNNYMARVPQVHISVGDNSSIGNITLGSNIQQSFNKVDAADISEDLKSVLKQLAEAVDTLSIGLSQDHAEEVADDFAKLVDEAIKKSPNKKWYSISIDVLIKAAENLGKIGEPVISLAKKVLSLLSAG
jgi:internalin A